MKKIKKLKVFRWVLITFMVLLSVSIAWHQITLWNYKNAAINYSTYNDDIMRFRMTLPKTKYNFTKYADFSKYDTDVKKLNEKSRQIELSGNINFGKYILTENGDEYVFTKIDKDIGWLKVKIPIEEEYREIIKSNFYSKKSPGEKITYIEVTPFNEGYIVLMRTISEEYVLDLKQNKVNWTRGQFYEVPTINFKTNTFVCEGDLGTGRYIFNNSGELIRTLFVWPF